MTVRLIFATLLCSCVVNPQDYAGHACDDTHACLDGRECVANRCVSPSASGGGSSGGGSGGGSNAGGGSSVGGGSLGGGGTGGGTDAGCAPTAELCDGIDNDCNGVIDDVSGCLYTFAGDGPPSFADGMGTAARFALPLFLTSDDAGFTYVADSLNHALRKVASDGTVTTLAGNGHCGFLDGPADQALLCGPTDVELASDGTLYFSDSSNHRVRKLSQGRVDTVAGSGDPGSSNGPALTATLQTPRGLTLLPNGDLLIADSDAHLIRRYVASGQTLTTEAGTSEGTADGDRSSVQLTSPWDVAAASSGTLYVSEFYSHRIRLLPVTGTSSTLAGTTTADYVEGSGATARFDRPTQLALAEDAGLLFVADSANQRVRAVPLGGASTFPVAGAETYGFRNGTTGNAAVTDLGGFTFTSAGVVISDGNDVLRRVTGSPYASATVSDFAGVAALDQIVDGPPLRARLRGPAGISLAADGTLYWGDVDACVVRSLPPDGGVVTLSGAVSPVDDGYVNGSGAIARLARPFDVKLSPVDGNLYIADDYNGAIRKLDLTTGVLSTFAGGYPRQPGSMNGALLTARFDTPQGLAFGKDGSGQPVLYVSDSGNSVVRKIDLSSGMVSTYAGTPGTSGTAEGPVGTGKFAQMLGLAADDTGQVFVCDADRVRRVAPDGTLSTLYPSLGFYCGSLALDGTQLFATGDTSIAALTTAGDPAVTLFGGSTGYHDGDAVTGEAMELLGLAVTPKALYVTDRRAHRLRRLWR